MCSLSRLLIAGAPKLDIAQNLIAASSDAGSYGLSSLSADYVWPEKPVISAELSAQFRAEDGLAGDQFRDSYFQDIG